MDSNKMDVFPDFERDCGLTDNVETLMQINQKNFFKRNVLEKEEVDTLMNQITCVNLPTLRNTLLKTSIQVTQSMVGETGEEEETFTCKHCCQNFHTYSSLVEHIHCHSSDLLFKCSKCSREFLEVADFANHIKAHLAEYIFSCKDCGKRFTHRSVYIDHCKLHEESNQQHDRKSNLCYICGKKFRSYDGIVNHLKTHQVESHPCKICSKHFSTREYLDNHIKLHTLEKDYKCKFCDSKFFRSSDLIKHMKLHIGGQPYACKICNSRFRGRYHLTKHVAEHRKNGEYIEVKEKINDFKIDDKRENPGVQKGSSEYAKNNFPDELSKPKSSSTLEVEQKYIKENMELEKVSNGTMPKFKAPLECKVCKKRFLSEFSLKIHSDAHIGEQKLVCSGCGKLFTTYGALYIHIKDKCSHISVCEYCGKTFPSRSLLRRHIKWHDSPSLKKCKICGKTFSTTSNLNRHTMIHTGTKPHKCNICDKGFIQKTTLETHMEVHTTGSFFCKICSKIFSGLRTFNQHLKYHNVNEKDLKAYSCDKCDKTFSRNKDMISHMRTHHEVKQKVYKAVKESVCEVKNNVQGLQQKIPLTDKKVNIFIIEEGSPVSCLKQREATAITDSLSLLDKGLIEVPETLYDVILDTDEISAESTVNELSECEDSTEGNGGSDFGSSKTTYDNSLVNDSSNDITFEGDMEGKSVSKFSSDCEEFIDDVHYQDLFDIIQEEEKNIIGELDVSSELKEKCLQNIAHLTQIPISFPEILEELNNFNEIVLKWNEMNLEKQTNGEDNNEDEEENAVEEDGHKNKIENESDDAAETYYECMVCGKELPTLAALNVHLRFHTGVRPHNCQVCSKSFFTSKGLNFHLRIHTM